MITIYVFNYAVWCLDDNFYSGVFDLLNAELPDIKEIFLYLQLCQLRLGLSIWRSHNTRGSRQGNATISYLDSVVLSCYLCYLTS